jgi:NTE family protein
MPTGYACAGHAPPVGAVANALHALTLIIARQLTTDLEYLDPAIDCVVVPPLCPLVGSPYDFSQTDAHISRARRASRIKPFRERCVRIVIKREASSRAVPINGALQKSSSQ